MRIRASGGQLYERWRLPRFIGTSEPKRPALIVVPFGRSWLRHFFVRWFSVAPASTKYPSPGTVRPKTTTDN